jgi:hypothetical protein
MSLSGPIFIYYVILRNYDVTIFGGVGGARIIFPPEKNFWLFWAIFGKYGKSSI